MRSWASTSRGDFTNVGGGWQLWPNMACYGHGMKYDEITPATQVFLSLKEGHKSSSTLKVP